MRPVTACAKATPCRESDNFGVPPAMVRRWNHLKGDSLRGRSVIYVHLPVSPGAGQGQAVATRSKSKQKKTVTASKSSGDSVVRHKVKAGETLFSIASTYKTTVDALKRDNRNIAILR